MNPLPGTTKEGIRWAHALLNREAAGEQLPAISCAAWREVLGFGADIDAKRARETVLGKGGA